MSDDKIYGCQLFLWVTGFSLYCCFRYFAPSFFPPFPFIYFVAGKPTLDRVLIPWFIGAAVGKEHRRIGTRARTHMDTCDTQFTHTHTLVRYLNARSRYEWNESHGIRAGEGKLSEFGLFWLSQNLGGCTFPWTASRFLILSRASPTAMGLARGCPSSPHPPLWILSHRRIPRSSTWEF